MKRIQDEYRGRIMEPTHKRNVVDLACGRLTPEESLALLDEVERNPALSAELDTAVELVNMAADPGEAVFRESNDVRESFWRRVAW